MKKNTASTLALAAAVAGMMGGTAARLNAQPLSGHSSVAMMGAMMSADKPEMPKHSCKGKNDCKGQGGGDAKHWGKNSCKGQGACATDGSKPKA